MSTVYYVWLWYLFIYLIICCRCRMDDQMQLYNFEDINDKRDPVSIKSVALEKFAEIIKFIITV